MELELELEWYVSIERVICSYLERLNTQDSFEEIYGERKWFIKIICQFYGDGNMLMYSFCMYV